MMPNKSPRWRRRSSARSAEIVNAALDLFAQNGFDATSLDAIGRGAGVSKATVYIYFDNKKDIFSAVLRAVAGPRLAAARSAAETMDGHFTELAPKILAHLADAASERPLSVALKMIVAESRRFPDLAKKWHDEIIGESIAVMTELITRAQQRGELRPGDSYFYALSLLGPILMGALFAETFGHVLPNGSDPQALAAQHARTVLYGMLADA